MKRRTKILLAFIVFSVLVMSSPELLHGNQGKSIAKGSPGKGDIENAWLIPYFGDNYRYFSPISYYLLNRGYAHHRVHNTILQAYETCASTCPNVQFRLMECGNKHGGKMWPHRTHQAGFSADFMLPKTLNEKPHRWLDHLGVWHYTLQTDKSGNYTSRVAVDFETMGRHLLALDDAARTNGLRIKKVILKIELKDDFFKTKSGRKVKARGIYFAKALPDLVNQLHDDHYHVDFSL
jgi:penicillin-insensitive murein endopeptidase